MILVASPIAKEVPNNPVISQLLHKGWDVLFEEGLDKSREFLAALLDGGLTSFEDCALLREFGKDLVHILRDVVGIRSGR